MDRIYVIAHQTEKVAYVGRTYTTVDNRFKQHISEALNSKSVTPKLERLRHDMDGFEVVEVTDGRSEAEWMADLQAEGFELLNATGGTRKAPKRAQEAAWKERPIYVPASRKGVALRAISSTQYEEYKALPDAEQRWAYIEALRPKRAA